ncbi:hypothetical protein FQR65_LT06129 [Abscondita terminalis]|nr:hypothetical protein FQR65_LT06129 [Abscondita terminalis]
MTRLIYFSSCELIGKLLTKFDVTIFTFETEPINDNEFIKKSRIIVKELFAVQSSSNPKFRKKMNSNYTKVRLQTMLIQRMWENLSC